VDAPYPTPPEDGMICYSRGSGNPNDYWLWVLTASEWGDKNCVDDGFVGADAGSKIHCPNGRTDYGCSSEYWY
jgi:hypothetical protein